MGRERKPSDGICRENEYCGLFPLKVSFYIDMFPDLGGEKLPARLYSR